MEKKGHITSVDYSSHEVDVRPSFLSLSAPYWHGHGVLALTAAMAYALECRLVAMVMALDSKCGRACANTQKAKP